VDVVTVDVVVTDKKGQSITGLTKSDFQVTEDDDPQAITDFEAVQLPAVASEKPAPRPRVSTNLDRESHAGRSFVILFDDIHLTLAGGQRAKAAVAQFLKTGVREGDRVSLVATGGGAWWSTRMEAGRDELIALLKRLDGRFIPDSTPERMSDYEAMRIHIYHDQQVEERVSRRFETYGASARSQTSQDANLYQNGDPFVQARASDVYFQSVSRNRITLEVLERVLLSLGAAKGRKAVILVSEGFIYDPNLDEFKDAVPGLAPRERGHVLPGRARADRDAELLHRGVRSPHRHPRHRGRLPGQPAGSGRGGVPGLGQRRVLREEHERPRPRHPAHRGREPQLLPPRLQLLEHGA
jgi:VWFA-related protein